MPLVQDLEEILNSVENLQALYIADREGCFCPNLKVPFSPRLALPKCQAIY
jgi:hypothetical protein